MSYEEGHGGVQVVKALQIELTCSPLFTLATWSNSDINDDLLTLYIPLKLDKETLCFHRQLGTISLREIIIAIQTADVAKRGIKSSRTGLHILRQVATIGTCS